MDGISALVESYEKQIEQILMDLVALRKQRKLTDAEKTLILQTIKNLEATVSILKKGRGQ